MPDLPQFVESFVNFLDPKQVSHPEKWGQLDEGWQMHPDFPNEGFTPYGDIDCLKLHRTLRHFVGEWIDTGFHPDGSEHPHERSFAVRKLIKVNDWVGVEDIGAAPEAIRAIAHLYDAEFLIPLQDGYHLSTMKSTSKNRFIFPFIRSTGGVSYTTDPVFAPDLLSLAARIFLNFFQSDALYRIMRCNQCKAIFLPDRKPRKRYERGWHCIKCRNIAAAKAATDERRKMHRKRWFALAVEEYRAYMNEPHRSTQDMIASLTERVNKRLPYSSRIKRNTITLNLKDIAVAAGLNGGKCNAKGK
jgi:hypothetical protein